MDEIACLASDALGLRTVEEKTSHEVETTQPKQGARLWDIHLGFPVLPVPAKAGLEALASSDRPFIDSGDQHRLGNTK